MKKYVQYIVLLCVLQLSSGRVYGNKQDTIISRNADSLKLTKAIATLQSYLQNDSLRQALQLIKAEIIRDSTAVAIKTLQGVDSSYIGSIMGGDKVDSLLAKFRKDATYQWFQKVQRDSVLLNILDGEGNYVRLWTNTSHTKTHRFWIHRNRKDSLGFWLHSLPIRGIMITPDFDIVQEKVRENYPSLLLPIPVRKKLEFFTLLPILEYPRIIMPWTKGMVANFDFTQTYFQHWVKGGQNAISMRSNILLFANYKRRQWEWENYLKWKYGIMQSESLDKFVKNEDLLEINTKVGLKASKSWYYSSQLNAKSQLFDGYEYDKGEKTRISTLLSPSYFSLAIGMDYKPNDNFSLLLSPLTARLIYIKDKSVNETTYGIKEGKHSWKQLGPYLKMKWKSKIIKAIEMENSVELFSNYIEHIENIDVDWSMSITMRINYFMSAKIATQLLYDDNVAIPLYENIKGQKTQVGVGKRVQFNENISIGFVFRI